MFDSDGNRKYLNATERSAFLSVAEKVPDAGIRAFAETLFYTGCRISEALNLTRNRVDLNDGVIVFKTLKRRSSTHFRAVPIPSRLSNLLSSCELCGKRTSRVWSFSRTTGYRVIKKLMARAGLAGAQATPKGLPHGFAVACVAHDIPLTTVQKWLGHAKIETTAIYLEISGREERSLAKRLW